MGVRAAGRPSRLMALRSAIADTVAILAFVTIGLLSHHGDLTLRGYARDALPFLGGWFAAALLFRLYSRPGWWRLAATWAIGVSAAVLVRALVLGRHLGSREAGFLVVSLVTVGVLVLGFRLLSSRVLRGTP
jgi:peptidoglycan/LPS O-acetylase OafA/YrhL